MQGIVTPVETIDADETVSKALKRLEDHELLVVTKQGKYFGELYPAAFLRFKDDAERVKAANVARKGSVIYERELGLAEVLRKFSSGKYSVIVLNKYEKPVGMISAAEVLKQTLESFRGMKVIEFMQKIGRIDANTAADKAEEMMVKGGVEELAVMENGKITGLLTARDLAVKVKPYLHKKMHDLEQWKRSDVEKERVAGILTPAFELESAGIADGAIEALQRAGFREPIVFDGAEIVGKLSFAKMLQSLKLKEEGKVEISGLSGEEGMLKESIFGECAKLLRKFGKYGNLHLRIKSARKSKGSKVYEVHGRLEMGGKTFICSTPELREHRANWDLWQAVKEVLDELESSYVKAKR